MGRPTSHRLIFFCLFISPRLIPARRQAGALGGKIIKLKIVSYFIIIIQMRYHFFSFVATIFTPTKKIFKRVLARLNNSISKVNTTSTIITSHENVSLENICKVVVAKKIFYLKRKNKYLLDNVLQKFVLIVPQKIL